MANKHKNKSTNKSLPLNSKSTTTTNSALSTPSNNGDAEAAHKFELELCWCIHKLQIALKSDKLNPKQVQEYSKNLNILMNTKSTLIRKRQIMSLMFGNYREKMEMEEKKLINGLKKLKVKVGIPSNKSQFLKKSSFPHCDNGFSDCNNKDDKDAPDLVEDNIVCGQADADTKNNDLTTNFKFTPSDNSFKFNFENTIGTTDK